MLETPEERVKLLKAGIDCQPPPDLSGGLSARIGYSARRMVD